MPVIFLNLPSKAQKDSFDDSSHPDFDDTEAFTSFIKTR